MKEDTYDYDTGGDLMGELKFQKLTPTQEADLSGYEDAFHYIFAEDDITNIAISGAYSSGKSSVIESFKKKHPDKKFFHLSLAHFQALDDGSLEDNDSEDNTKMTAQEDAENNRVHYDGRPDLFKLSTKYTEDELRVILNNDQTPVFVCTDSDSHVLGHGFCVLQRPENTRLLNDIQTLYIDDICVDQAARDQHVGRMIYEQIITFARQCCCYNVTLNVWSCNPGAIKFYERLGLVPYKIGMETLL